MCDVVIMKGRLKVTNTVVDNSTAAVKIHVTLQAE